MGKSCCEENNTGELVEGSSQHKGDAPGSTAGEGFSLQFAGKFQGPAMGPGRFGIKKGLI